MLNAEIHSLIPNENEDKKKEKKKKTYKVSHVVDEDPAVIRGAWNRVKIYPESDVVWSISSEHAFRGPIVPRVDYPEKTLINIDPYSHVPIFAGRSDRRLKLVFQELSAHLKQKSVYIQSYFIFKIVPYDPFTNFLDRFFGR